MFSTISLWNISKDAIIGNNKIYSNIPTNQSKSNKFVLFAGLLVAGFWAVVVLLEKPKSKVAQSLLL